MKIINKVYIVKVAVHEKGPSMFNTPFREIHFSTQEEAVETCAALIDCLKNKRDPKLIRKDMPDRIISVETVIYLRTTSEQIVAKVELEDEHSD